MPARAPRPNPAPSPEPVEWVDPSPAELGRRIKLLRVSRGLTLKEVEAKGNISATHISEIERGKASPTLGALRRIAEALGVRPATLVEPRARPRVTLTRAAQRAERRLRWGEATLDPVAECPEGAELSAHLMRLPVGRGPALEHRHEGEEWVTVLSGTVEIRVGDEAHALREGESLHFRAERTHAYTNPASGPALLLVASRPRLTL